MCQTNISLAITFIFDSASFLWRFAGEWTASEPTGCETKCGTMIGSGTNGNVECSTGSDALVSSGSSCTCTECAADCCCACQPAGFLADGECPHGCLFNGDAEPKDCVQPESDDAGGLAADGSDCDGSSPPSCTECSADCCTQCRSEATPGECPNGCVFNTDTDSCRQPPKDGCDGGNATTVAATATAGPDRTDPDPADGDGSPACAVGMIWVFAAAASALVLAA